MRAGIRYSLRTLRFKTVTHGEGSAHGFSVADAPGGRSGEFEIGNSSLHETMTPGESVMRKCAASLAAGRQPIVITRLAMLAAADAFAEAQGVSDQLDILDAEQFLVANLYELGGFRADRQRVTVESLIDKYNEIVELHETESSLRISARLSASTRVAFRTEPLTPVFSSHCPRPHCLASEDILNPPWTSHAR